MLEPTEPKRLLITRTLPGMESTGQRTEGRDRIPADLLLRRKAARRLVLDCRRERNAIEQLLTLPAESESLHFIVDGRFEPCDLIPAIRRLSHPATIARLDISTLGFNTDNVATIARGMDQQKIGQVLLICSHYFSKAEPAAFQNLQQEIGGRGGRVAALRTHAKLMLLEMTDGRCFTIEGSGNLRSCRSIEQFVLANDRPLLLFHRTWLDEYLATCQKNAASNVSPAKT